MNRIIKINLINSFSRCHLNLTQRNIGLSSRLLLSKKNDDNNSNNKDEVINEMSQVEIDRIKTFENDYFSNVKDSFDKLQASRKNETFEEKKSRLMYQSRKRGISENGLLLSHFAAEYIPKMNAKQLVEYDAIINNLHNEWDLYYWLTAAVQLPKQLESNEVLQLMKKYCANDLMEKRIVQPNLPPIKNVNK